MRKGLSAVRITALISLVAVFQLVINSCSKQIFPETVNQNLESQVGEKKLKEFIVSGTGKEINSQKASADEIIKTARIYIGVPHCMGGTTMKCMDCSGLLVSVFGKHGIYLPHNSEEQAKFGSIIRNSGELIKGDMVFFIKTYNTPLFITHSGIYIGNNNFIHTSSSKGVTITSLNDPWWSKKFAFGTRILNN
jgi:cell wall-associated NlpC family hydrolase